MFGEHHEDSGIWNGSDSSPEKMKSSTCAYIRKRNKPLMEKRRRARINDALVQLKALVLESMQQDTTQYSKLEKADILEMTVSHVASLQKLQIIDGPRHNVSPISKYRVGFNECANEVIRYLGEYRDGTCSELRTRLLNHLAGCIETSNFMRRGTIGKTQGNLERTLKPQERTHETNELPHVTVERTHGTIERTYKTLESTHGTHDTAHVILERNQEMLRQRGVDQPNKLNNCVNSQTDGHLRDITFQNQAPDSLVSGGNETFPLQRDSTKRQLRFHGNQLSGETSAQTIYSRLQMPGVSQPEENQYSPLMNRNQTAERQKRCVQMPLAASDRGDVRNVTGIETNIENMSDTGSQRGDIYTHRRGQHEAEVRVGRGSLLNRHVNQLSARDTYGTGPVPLFTRTDKNNNRLVDGQMDCNGGALVDGFNRQNKAGASRALCTGEYAKNVTAYKHSRHFDTHMKNIDLIEEKAPAPSHLGFSSDGVWRPW